MRGFTRQETEDFLIESHYLGIDNVLAVRGDDHGYQKSLEHGRSRDVHAATSLPRSPTCTRGFSWRSSWMLTRPTSASAALHNLEKYFEVPNLATDVGRIKKKLNVGASCVVTQMFFDNAHYYRLLGKCWRQKITVPAISGRKILTTRCQLKSFPSTFHVEVPITLSKAVNTADNDQVRDIGIARAVDQTRDLLDHGVPTVHFYVMGNSWAVGAIVSQLEL